MIIYKITNKVNNKIYIGQTTRTLDERIRGYRNDIKFKPNSRPIISAMVKYGFENFTFEILKDNIQSKKELDFLEREYIKKYASLTSQNGYNVELGGNSVGSVSTVKKQKEK